MTKLEYLNSFFIKRLLSVAGEIYEAVKDTICEYEDEIERTKLENYHLREILCEVNERKTAASPDVQPSHSTGAPLEQMSNLDSDPSVLQRKLELATMKKEGDQTSQAVPQELPDFSQEPLDNHTSIIQVKVALSTMHQDVHESFPQSPSAATVDNKNVHESSLQSSSAATAYNEDVEESSLQFPSIATADNKEQSQHFSRKTLKEENIDDCPYNDSGFPVKLEPMDSQTICCNNTTMLLRENTTNNHFEDLQDDHSSPCPQWKMPSDNFSFGNTFRQSKQHMAVHQQGKPRPYRCDLCGKCYSYAQVLENHRRTHTGERPYHCRFCGRCFKQKGHVNDHERIHTGEKPFNCLVCGRRFIQSSQLKRHVRIHHKAKQQI